MKEIIVLKENKWLSLLEMKYPEKGIGGYVYSHEGRCDGKIVSILPYRHVVVDGEEKMEFMLRSEVTPCWHPTDEQVSSITGGVELDDPLSTAVHELKEEAGYVADESEFVSLGTCRGTKSVDTVYYLYMVDCTGKERGEATGDGSELETLAHCFWTDTISDAVDPMVYVSYYRLKTSND